MKIGLVGGSYQERSLPFDAQRTVNCYPVFDKQGKEASALYGTPGLSLFAVTGSGSIRGEFKATNGRAFAVSGSSFYEIDAAGNATSLGSLDQSQGIVYMAENGQQLGICDGKSLYMFKYSDNSFIRVTDPDLPDVGTLGFIDGYFVVSELNSGRFRISALYDGESWHALDFATAESSPDNLGLVINAAGQLWALGDFTSEIWTNTGDATFPFERISGSKLSVGIVASATGLELDGSLFWLGQNKEGTGIVYRANGFTPQRISNSAIEQQIQKASNIGQVRAYAYQEDGHSFYILTGGGLETSLAYDLSTGIWHERAYLNSEGRFEQHLASCGMVAFGKTLVGDRRNGNIYEMSLKYYSDNGEAMAFDRVYTHLSDQDRLFQFNELIIGVESGVGTLSGDGSDPKIMMRLSKDGARTWSDWAEATIGKIGQYRNKARFRRLGAAEQMTFHVRITDPVKRAICGSYLR
jgi:hypothetical protein